MIVSIAMYHVQFNETTVIYLHTNFKKMFSLVKVRSLNIKTVLLQPTQFRKCTEFNFI